MLFRDGQGQIGLLMQHCSHRGTSLEFGTVERYGIRCCYHGWLYGVDGRILDTPGEPADSTYKDRFVHGAYPTLEYKGLVFVYMGPPDERPAFPILDTFEMPGWRMVPQWGESTPSNWLQQAENNMDPVHLVYLHRFEEVRAKLDAHRPSVDPARTMEHYIDVGLEQWEDDVRTLTEDTRRNHLFEWQEIPTTGFSYSWTRRIGDLVWVRIADVIPPNVDQIPRSLPVSKETQELLFDPPRTTTWTVPVDDTNTITASFAYLPGNARAERRREGPLSVHGRNHPDADLRGPAAAAGPLGGAGQPAPDRGARSRAPGLVRHGRGDVPQGDTRWHPRGQPRAEPDARAARRERRDPHPRAEHDLESPSRADTRSRPRAVAGNGPTRARGRVPEAIGGPRDELRWTSGASPRFPIWIAGWRTATWSAPGAVATAALNRRRTPRTRHSCGSGPT